MDELGLPSAHEDDPENAARAASSRQPILVLCAARRALFRRWIEWGSAGELIKLLSRAGVPHEEDETVDADKGSQKGQVAAGYGLGNLALYLGSYIQSKDYLERALSNCRKIGNQQSEGWLLASLGQLGVLTRANEAAREHCQGALAIAEQVGSPDQRGYTLTYLGHAYLGLRKLDDSYRSFQNAAAIRQGLELSGLLMDDLAGLACVELDRGELAQARSYVEEILSYLSSHPSANMDEPARVYLTCLRTLGAAGDLRAQAITEIGFAWLQECAAKIRGEAEQSAFLRNVPANREIVAEWEKRTYEE